MVVDWADEYEDDYYYDDDYGKERGSDTVQGGALHSKCCTSEHKGLKNIDAYSAFWATLHEEPDWCQPVALLSKLGGVGWGCLKIFVKNGPT